MLEFTLTNEHFQCIPNEKLTSAPCLKNAIPFKELSEFLIMNTFENTHVIKKGFNYVVRPIRSTGNHQMTTYFTKANFKS